MKALIASCSIPVVLVAILATAGTGGEERGSGPRLAHMVFFQLQDPTPDSKEKLVAACKKYLSEHDGTVYFSVGTRAADMARDVNDVEFDVALHLVFRNKAAHDTYQTSPRHQKFIDECKAGWKKVRVFDSYLGAVRDEGARDQRAALPDAASSFAGMVRGKVAAKRDGGMILFEVEEVVELWKHSKAPDAKSLVGQKVLVKAAGGEGGESRRLRRFLRLLDIGEVVSLDLAHKEGETLSLVELTEEQRARVSKAE